MHRRFLVRGLTASVVIAMLGACASVSGLDQYSTGTCADCAFDGDATTSPDVPQTDDVTSDTNDTADTSYPVDDVTWEGPWCGIECSDAAEDVADAGSEGAVIEGGPASDAAPPRDGGDAGRIDAAPHDAALADASPDVASCNSMSCNGCCTTSGLCGAGGLNNACGIGGAACKDCTASGQVCTSGACGTAPADAGDAGSTGCDPTKCTNLCVPYFIQCCKADQSCGCAVFYPRGSCN